MIAKYFTASIISLLSFGSASVLGFVAPTYNNVPTSSLLPSSSAAAAAIKSSTFRSLQMTNNGGDDADDDTDDNKNKFQKNLKKTTASILAAAFIFGMSIPAPAIAATASSLADNTNSYSFSVIDSSSQIVAARRSGGRAGGRARPAMRSRPSSSSSSSRTVINRNTYISPPSRSVYVAPPVYGGGFGYNPYGGLGLGLGLNAIGNVGRDMQDYRQEGEIRDTRVELEKSRMREADLESRLRQLEQGQSGLQQQQQFQQMQQQQAANAAAAAAVTKQ